MGLGMEETMKTLIKESNEQPEFKLLKLFSDYDNKTKLIKNGKMRQIKRTNKLK